METEIAAVTAEMSSEQRARLRGKSIVGMALAIMGLVLCWMGLVTGFPGMISVALCVVGILLSKLPPFDRITKIIGWLGIILSAVCSLIGFLLAGSLIASWF